jgi:hypothetical protein
MPIKITLMRDQCYNELIERLATLIERLATRREAPRSTEDERRDESRACRVGFDAPEASNNLCYNVAISIKYRAVGHPVLKAQETPDAVAGVTEKSALYASA